MDIRDRQLNRHMLKRRALAAALPVERQRIWAKKCTLIAGRQCRTTYYLMSQLWLSDLG